jgi:hypothetical protein
MSEAPMRLSEIISYDRERAVVLALDWRTGSGSPTPLDDAAAISEALDGGLAADGDEATRLGCLGLALVARRWLSWPSDAARGALLQAAEQLRAGLAGYGAAGRLDEAASQADAAILAGAPAEEALLSLAEEQAAQLDRAAERCGRHAAGLLDDEDGVVALPLGARSLAWTLHAVVGQGRSLRLFVPSELASTAGARRLAAWAERRSVALELTGEQPNDGVCLAEARLVALDGGVALAPDVTPIARRARHHGPVYVLAPVGPDPAAPQIPEASAGDERSIASAIVTSRGIYRPAMVARHLSEDDEPLDVIPLL